MANFVEPDSVLARTAREVMAAHAGGAGPREGMTTCPICGEPLPCTSGRRAAEVLFAAGLAELSGLIEAARGGLGPAASLDLPATLPRSESEPIAEFDESDSVTWSGGSEPVTWSGESEPVAPSDGSDSWSGESEPSEPVSGLGQDHAEVDPLLLGPPIFTQQNRPLDAPRFTPSARPPVRPQPPAEAEPTAQAAAESAEPDASAESAEVAAPAQSAESGGSDWSGGGLGDPAGPAAGQADPSQTDAALLSASAPQPSKPVLGGRQTARSEQSTGEPPSGLTGVGPQSSAAVPQEAGQAGGVAGNVGATPGTSDDTPAPSPFLRRTARPVGSPATDRTQGGAEPSPATLRKKRAEEPAATLRKKRAEQPSNDDPEEPAAPAE